MELFKSKNQCCGCTACEVICPKNAIKMEADIEGFLYPNIDNNKCIECRLCERICAFNEHYDIDDLLEKPIAYAVKHKNESERLSSRSGGMFIALSDYILARDGVIYGAAFDNNFNVKHIRVENKEQRDKLKGSKYVQSDIRGSFEQVKNDLKNGKYVLFSGTPCQTAALRRIVKNSDTSKLIVCDIICHGAPSQKIWKEYLEFIENKYNDKIVEANFRDKSFGWHTHFESYKLKNKKNKIRLEYFTGMFRKHIIFRPACETCKYANLRRPSDITLGDFWRINKVLPNYKNDDKGISLVLINNNKGKRIFEAVARDVLYESADIDETIQPNLKAPSRPLVDRNKFWEDYRSNGMKYIIKYYGGNNIKDRSKKFIYRKIIKRFK